MFDAPLELLDGPALEAPYGVVPHLTRTSPEQKWYYICVPLFTVVPGIFLALRFYTKIKIVRKMDWTDYFIAISFMIFLVSLGMARLTLHYGAGVHQWNLRLGDFMHQLFWLNIGEALYCPCIFLIKTSIVLQYLQILAPVRTSNEVMYFGGWAAIIAMFIFYTADIPLTLFICVPREKIWNPYYEGGKCMDYNALVVSSAGFNILSDLVILLLPVRTVLKLRINLKKKVAIILLFATGLLATLASSMRILYMVKLQNQGKNQDSSYEMAWMGLWSWAEVVLGIIVSCTLTMPKLYRAKSKRIAAVSSTIWRPITSLKTIFQTRRTRIESQKSNELEYVAHDVQLGAPTPENKMHMLTIGSIGSDLEAIVLPPFRTEVTTA